MLLTHASKFLRAETVTFLFEVVDYSCFCIAFAPGPHPHACENSALILQYISMTNPNKFLSHVIMLGSQKDTRSESCSFKVSLLKKQK